LEAAVKYVLLDLLVMMGAAGCAVADTRGVDEREQRERFPFLREGETTMAACIAALGEPSARYEGGRVLAWHMAAEKDKLVTSVSSHPVYNLMLAFDGRGVLVRFNLVEIR
jgi:hypothetical protein